MLTPFQTAGPFLDLGLRVGVATAVNGVAGSIAIRGRLIDGAGAGIPDGVVECWHPGLAAMGRSLTDRGGAFTLTTTRPEEVAAPDGSMQAPHLAIRVLGRGILTQYITRLYFPDDPRNASDPVLNLVPHDRRQTLIAIGDGEGKYRFDIILQGSGETVFFDV